MYRAKGPRLPRIPALKRILVTGASGLIGRHCIARLLQQGAEVHAVGRAAPSISDGVAFHAIDLLREGEAAALLAQVRPSHLLHLAWYAEPGRFWRAPENFRWVEATLQLARAFVDSGGERLVGAGSCAEYDWRFGVCHESDTPLRPSTPYGVCKLATASLLESFSALAGLEFAWGRIFHLYGPTERPPRLVASVIDSLLRGAPALCSQGDQIRDFLHVEDVARAFVALLDSPVMGAVNVASGVPVRVREIVLQIGDLLGARDQIELGAMPTAAGEPPVLLADIGRLRDELGWSPTLSLDEGLRSTIDWWIASRNSSATAIT